MNRLQAELQRLYLPPVAQRQDPDGRVRAMVLELARPASWDGLAKAWRGVQADLELPAPAIAVSGSDGYQLWFSLAQPVPVGQAMGFLEALRGRYLGDVAQERIGMHACVAASAPGSAQQPVPPPVERGPGRWSAFVSPDLAALFADEPWLDIPPGPDAQADLLSRLASTRPEDFKRALERLGPVGTPGSTRTPPAPVDAGGRGNDPADTRPAAAADRQDPRGFLLGIMNDRTLELQLRIEAAKALLPYFECGRPL
ncbi:MAG: hypothetical protein JWQ13_3170 [Ramlibacter sp.]|jgi:hypothetical protein|nr:hypothetical protein [Ramlibacter sp.]